MLKKEYRNLAAAGGLLILLLVVFFMMWGSDHGQVARVKTLPYPGNPSEAERFNAAVQAQEYILYARTPDPELAARRTVALRRSIEDAAQGVGFPADTVSGIIFLESGGDPLIGSPSKAAGLGQFMPKVARKYHLRVDPPKRVLPILQSARRGNMAALTKLRLIDQRYDPQVALPATVKYLKDHFVRLGGELDIAVAAYHMGQPNLEKVVRNYCSGNPASPWRSTLGQTIRGNHLTWTKILEDVSPGGHPKTYQALTKLRDSSWSYWYRVSCAEKVLEEWQDHPDRFREKVQRYRHPQPKRRYELAEESDWYGTQHRWENWADLELADNDGTIIPAWQFGSFGFTLDGNLGQWTTLSRLQKDLIRTARPAMIGMLGYLGTNYRDQLHSDQAHLRITALVRTDNYEAELTKKRKQNLFSSHSLGYAVDIAVPATQKADQVLQFLLTKLRNRRDIVWVKEKGQPHYHVCLSPEGAERFRDTYALMR